MLPSQRLASHLGLTLACLGLATPAFAEDKCGWRPGAESDLPEIVLIVDDELIADHVNRELIEPFDIWHVEILCWQEVEAKLGIRVASAAVYAVTRGGLVGGTTRNLAVLVDAQDAHHRRNGRYARSLAELGGYAPPNLTYVSLVATADGWMARADHDYVAQRCYAFVGTMPELWAEELSQVAAGLTERTPACFQPTVRGLEVILAADDDTSG